jgi:valyl-tRNA synthetase
MEPLAKLALDAVDAGKIKFVPDNYEKIFRYWMSNTIDWNISRQIVWGIPIPAKICTACDHAFLMSLMWL